MRRPTRSNSITAHLAWRDEARDFEGVILGIELELPSVLPPKQPVAAADVLLDPHAQAIEHQRRAAFRLRGNPVEVVRHVFLH
jgi:hypothetical protein